MHWDVIGHERQKKYFEHAKLSHAYLLHGPKGVGKCMFICELAEHLMSDGGMPLDHNPDFRLLKPGVNQETGKPADISVDTIRAMKHWAYVRPLYGARKIVVIDDAERMSADGANTMLKVLEEPPAYLHFFLVSSQSGDLLPTIASRCHGIAFRLLDDHEMDVALTGLKLDADDRKLLTIIAAGSPGTAYQLVRDNKLSAVAHAIAGLKKALTSGVAERIRYAGTITDDDDAPQIVGWWLAWMRAELPLRPEYAPVLHRLLDLHATISETKYNRRLALEHFLL